MVNNKVSDQQSFVTEGSDIQQTKFQTGEWCVGGCFEQGGQYTVIDRTGSVEGAGPCGPEGADV